MFFREFPILERELKIAHVLGCVGIEMRNSAGFRKANHRVAICADDLSRLGIPDHHTVDFRR